MERNGTEWSGTEWNGVESIPLFGYYVMEWNKFTFSLFGKLMEWNEL